MDKLKLSLDELSVQTFEVAPRTARHGTVYARGTDVITECIEYTCDDVTCDGQETACVACEQQTATCIGGCGGGFSQVYTCLYTCTCSCTACNC